MLVSTCVNVKMDTKPIVLFGQDEEHNKHLTWKGDAIRKGMSSTPIVNFSGSPSVKIVSSRKYSLEASQEFVYNLLSVAT